MKQAKVSKFGLYAWMFLCGAAVVLFGRDALACQSGITDGTITVDGRPLAWKVRELDWRANHLVYHRAGIDDSDNNGVADQYSYVAVIDPKPSYPKGEEVRMGLNMAGLSSAQNHGGGGNSGWPNSHFLAHMATVDEVRNYANSTAHTNMAGIYFIGDVSGDACVWEVEMSNSYAVYEYDTRNTNRASQTITTTSGTVSRLGFVVRYNDPFHAQTSGADNATGDSKTASGEGAAGSGLIALDKAASNLTAKTVWQGLDGASGKPDKFDFMRSQASPGHVSGTVVLGVRTNEDPRLSTMFTGLGHVRYTIAIPVWAMVTNLPPTMDNSNLTSFASIVGGSSAGTNYAAGIGLFAKFTFVNSSVGGYTNVQLHTLPMEAKYFDTVLDKLLPEWRTRNWADTGAVAKVAGEMTRVENQMAADAYSLLERMLNGTHDDNNAPIGSQITSASANKLVVSLAATAVDSDGTITNTLWNYGDGSTGTGTSVSHTYAADGTYLVSFTVTDNDGVSYTDWSFVNTAGCTMPVQPGAYDLTLHAGHTNDLATLKPNLLFMGDSITRNWLLDGPVRGLNIWNNYYTNRIAYNIGISGETIQNLLWRVMNGDFANNINPKAAIMVIGTNNSEDYTNRVAGMRVIVDYVLTNTVDTKVFVLGIFPRESPVTTTFKGIFDELAKWPATNRIKIININDIFYMPGTSNLNTSLFGDGRLHPNEDGYQCEAQALDPYIGEVLGETNIFVGGGVPSVPSGGTNTFTVRLVPAPSVYETVTVSRVSGNAGLSVYAGASNLVFTPANGTNWQTVTLYDAPGSNGAAFFQCTAPGRRSVSIKASGPAASTGAVVNTIMSTNAISVVEGSTASFSVYLSAAPTNDWPVSVTWASGDTDLSVQSGSYLVFTTNNWSTPQTVVIAAAPDADFVNSSAVFQILDGTNGLGTAQFLTATEVDTTTNPEQLLPFSETFETSPTNMAGTLGAVNGQHSWVSSSGNNVVTTNKAHGGSQSLEIDAGSVSHSFTNAASAVNISCWAIPCLGETNSAIPSGASAVFWFGTNGQVFAYSNSQLKAVSCSVVTGTWNKFDITCDYTAHVWSLNINATNVIQRFGFYSNRTAFSEFRLANESSAAFLDDVSISVPSVPSSPFDDWLMLHYGTTNVNVTALASNGVNTILGAYIAGLDPLSPTNIFELSGLRAQASNSILSWSPAATGRLYSVYWSSNLLSGFGIMTSNLTSGTFTDAVHGAEASGFYQIKVQVAP